MATWENSTAIQGAASGAAIGSAIPGVGTAIGAGIGFLAGGILGGMSSDAAKRAEERRREEIQRAIDRQNQSTYEAKRNAEQWALADIGVGRQDQYQQAQQDTEMYDSILSNTQKAYDDNLAMIDKYEMVAKAYSGSPFDIHGTAGAGNNTMPGGPRDNSDVLSKSYQRAADKLSGKTLGLERNVQLAQGQVNMNQGILSNFDLSTDRKY